MVKWITVILIAISQELMVGVYMKTGKVINRNLNNDIANGHWKVIFIRDNYEVNNCNFTEINPIMQSVQIR